VARLDVAYHQRRHEVQMQDDAYRREYELARRQVAQVDAVMRQLDALREEAGLSKAQLARLIGKDPATVRRLFTAEVNPELKTVVSIAAALGAEIRITPAKHRGPVTESELASVG
jgi:DNA-binding XRE family transcriptional regulator